jgi:hypothetical protein
MLEGHSKADIIEAIPELFPGIDAGQLIGEAVDSFAIVSQEPSASLLGWCLEASRVLYRKCVEVGDFTGALQCVKEVHRLTTNPARQ